MNKFIKLNDVVTGHSLYLTKKGKLFFNFKY